MAEKKDPTKVLETCPRCGQSNDNFEVDQVIKIEDHNTLLVIQRVLCNQCDYAWSIVSGPTLPGGEEE